MLSSQIRRTFIVCTTGAGLAYTALPKVYADGGKMVKVRDLPIYTEPKEAEVIYEPEPDSAFRRKVSQFRKILFKYLDSIEDTTDLLQQKYEVSKAHSNDLITYLREDSGALPRAAFITVAGLGGAVAGYKGGVIRKAFLSTLGITGAASICYPNQAVDITSTGWDTMVEKVTATWKGEAKKVTEKSAEVENVDSNNTSSSSQEDNNKDSNTNEST